MMSNSIHSMGLRAGSLKVVFSWHLLPFPKKTQEKMDKAMTVWHSHLAGVQKSTIPILSLCVPSSSREMGLLIFSIIERLRCRSIFTSRLRHGQPVGRGCLFWGHLSHGNLLHLGNLPHLREPPLRLLDFYQLRSGMVMGWLGILLMFFWGRLAFGLSF